MVHPERALQTAIAVVLAFSLLWTIAILIPDDVPSQMANRVQSPKFGLVVNGTRYILDTDVGDDAQLVEDIRIIHPLSADTISRVRNVQICAYLFAT